jgi:O-antigen ligase
MATDVRVAAAAPSTRIGAGWLLLLLPLVIGGFVDLPRAIRLGPVTALGLLSGVQLAIAAVGLLAVGRYPRAVVAVAAPYAIFVGWMVLRTLTESPGQGGIQTGLTYMLFGAQFLLAGTLAARDPAVAMRVLTAGFAVLDVVGLGLVATSFVSSGLGGGEWLIGPRAVALFANVPICWHLGGWCYGRPRAGLRALAWLLAVLASLSRTATAVGLLLVVFAYLAGGVVKPTRLVTRTPGLVIAAAALLVVVFVYRAEFNERFFEGLNSVEVGGVTVEASGRNHIWPVVVESGWRHPTVGGGLGSSQRALTDFDTETVGHPHNEYLRIWHDGGFIGLVLFAAAALVWLVLLARRWWRSRTGGLRPDVGLAALLALVGMLLAAITDNGFVYAYVMSPSGALIGAAFGFHAVAAHAAAAVVHRPISSERHVLHRPRPRPA